MNAKTLGKKAIGALGDFKFAFAGECLGLHRIFVDATDDDGCSIGAGERTNALEFFFAVFEVDRIDDAFALAIGESKFDRARVGGVDHDGDFNFADELVVERRDVGNFVAVCALQANVYYMRAAFHLPASDLGGFLPQFCRNEALELARADYVGALADDKRARALFRLDNFDAGIHCTMSGIRRTPGRLVLDHLRDRANVLFGGATAAANDVEPAAIDKALELLRERSGRFLVEAFFIGQASVGIARDETAGERLQGANMIGHEFRARGAIEAERNQIHMVERRPQRLDALTGKHGSHRFDGDGNHGWNGLAEFLTQLLNGEEAGLDVASVLAGFQKKEVRAAFDEAARLFAIIILKLFKINAAGDADGFCGGTHGTGHEPRLCGRGELVSGLARQFSSDAAEFAGTRAEAVFRQYHRGAAEGVCFDDVRAGLEIFPVD